MNDPILIGPIDTSFNDRARSTAQHSYVCYGCAQSIDVPTGTDRCAECMAEKERAA